MILSSTLGFSPLPPVSVYSTGRHALAGPALFLRVWLPALSARPEARGTFRFQGSLPYGVQPTIPSVGGSVTPRSRLALHGE